MPKIRLVAAAAPERAKELKTSARFSEAGAGSGAGRAPGGGAGASQGVAARDRPGIRKEALALGGAAGCAVVAAGVLVVSVIAAAGFGAAPHWLSTSSS